MPTKLILDGDYGIDDALALLYLAHQPDVEILAVGTVHGNATAADAARNALLTLDAAGLAEVPVAIGATRPICQPVEPPRPAHAPDGLGGRASSLPAPGRAPGDAPAAVQIVETVRAHPGRCTILATGPLTNLALAALLDPELPGLVRGVVAMGGTLGAPGNAGPYTEFNVGRDPEAADVVVAAGWPVTLVGLDVTMRVRLGAPHLRVLAAATGPAGRFAWSILQPYLGFYSAREPPGCPLHDPSAACVVVDPTLVGCVEHPVRVELRSELTRGMLVVDRRPAAEEPGGRPPVRVASDVDSSRLVDTFVRGLVAG